MQTLRLIVVLAAAVLAGCGVARKPNFVDQGNGIITVSSSPLMWQKGRSQLFANWEDAKKYVDDLELGGYTDWRLPTKDEFLDLYFAFDFGNAKAGKDTIVLTGNYWSAEKDSVGYAGSWKDGASCEISRSYKPAQQGYVRAVRP